MKPRIGFALSCSRFMRGWMFRAWRLKGRVRVPLPWASTGPIDHRALHMQGIAAVALSGVLAISLSTLAGAATEPVRGVGTSVDLDAAGAFELSQAAIGREIGEYAFVDRFNRPLRLRDLRGRPVVISMVYTSCYHTCSIATKHLQQVVEVAWEALGERSFSVLTIGFDAPVDSPVRMLTYARERGIDHHQWKFLSTDAATIAGLSRDLGFIFQPSPKGFDHTVQTTIVDAGGIIYRQVYGENFPAPSLVEPLKQLVLGEAAEESTLTGWVAGVRLFCTVYDPSSGRYRFDYSLFVAIGVGVLSLGGLAVFILRAWRESSASANVRPAHRNWED